MHIENQSEFEHTRQGVKQTYSVSNIYWVAFVLYILAFSIRVIGAPSLEPQADELHWRMRSYKIIERLRTPDADDKKLSFLQRLARFSDHLGHPGIPPAIVMATGEYIGDSINKARGLKFENDGYIDHLMSARIANCLVSSLVVPLLFVLGSYCVGFESALLGACLFLFYPYHIGLSRMAHLDAIMTLFVTLSVLCFARLEQKQLEKHSRGWFKFWLCASVSWGLAIATKPTAAALIGGYVLYRCVRWLIRLKADANSAFWVITWTDVWAVIVGQVVLCAISTRFWSHPSQYITRLKVSSSLADYVYRFGTTLGSLKLGTYLLSIALLSLLAYCIYALRKLRATEALKIRRYAILRHVMMIGSIVILLLLSTLLFPQIVENLIRFWTWAMGLSSTEHVAYGRTVQPPAYGYAAIVMKRIPLLILFGLLAAIICICSRKFPIEHRNKTLAFMILVFSVSMMWLLILGVSSKQTMRYAAPLMPIIYLIAASGLVAMCRFAGKFSRGIEVCLVVGYGISSLSWSPHFLLYHNYLFGGLSGAALSGEELPFAGQTEIIKELHALAKKSGEKLRVKVVGDVNTLRETYRRLYPSESKMLLFPVDRGPSWGHIVVDFTSFFKQHNNVIRKEIATDLAEPLMNYSFHGVELAKVVRMKLNDFSTPVVFPSERFSKHVGSFIVDDAKNANSAQVIYATPARDEKGYIATGILIVVPPGTYEIRPRLLLKQNINTINQIATDQTVQNQVDIETANRNTVVAKFDISSNCLRDITSEELSTEVFKETPLVCTIAKERIIHLDLFWFGQTPIEFDGVTMQRYLTSP